VASAGRRYEPDFVVEAADAKLIVEVKAERDLNDPVVLEKARAARAWVEHANGFAAEADGKTWGYAIIADRAITQALTFEGLAMLAQQG
jgi:type III restriction enzyme